MTLTSVKNEHHGDTDENGVVSFDMLCRGINGEQFLIEVQRRPHPNFKERTIFYASRLISDQAPKVGIKHWKYHLTKVYFVIIMDMFGIEDGRDKEYLHRVCFCNSDTGSIFYDKLHSIYIELRNFVLKEQELKTGLEKWLYSLKHSAAFKSAPFYVSEPIFKSFFNTAAYSNLTKGDKAMYDLKLKNEWDYHLVRDYDLEQAELKGKIDVIENMITELRLADEQIARIAEVSVDFVKKVRDELNK